MPSRPSLQACWKTSGPSSSSKCSVKRNPGAARANTEASLALRTASGSRLKSSPSRSIKGSKIPPLFLWEVLNASIHASSRLVREFVRVATREHSFQPIEFINEVLLDYLRIIEIDRAHCGRRCGRGRHLGPIALSLAV